MSAQITSAKTSIFDVTFDPATVEDAEARETIIHWRDASKPLSAPESHETRAITLLGPADLSKPWNRRNPVRLQKVWRYASPDHHPTQPQGTWDGQQGTNGIWEEGKDKPTVLRHTAWEIWLDDLRDFLDLHEHLKRQDLVSPVLGRLSDAARRFWCDSRWDVPARTGTFYVDRKTVWFAIDIDDLECTPEDAESAIADYISKYLPELEGCAYVATHTGSSGCKGKGKARVRLWFQLAEARTLRDMGAYIEAAKGLHGGDVDASIYEPTRLLFSAEPDVYADVADGDSVRRERASRPAHSRAWYVPGDLASIPVAPEKPQNAPRARAASGSLQLTKPSLKAHFDAMGPGQYNVHIWPIICHYAWLPQATRGDRLFEEMCTRIEDRVRETCDKDLDKRLRDHCDRDKLRKAWDRALADKQAKLDSKRTHGSVSAHGTAVPAAADSIEAVRADLKTTMRELVDELLKGGSKHALLRYPAGCGKTSALIEALARPGVLCSNVIRITVPNHELAAQLVRDLKAAARKATADGTHYGVVLEDQIRHAKGRNQPGMCPDDDSRPLAKRAEELGVSPKVRVCPNCVTGKAKLCPWLKQDEDDDNEISGIIVEVHSAATAIKKQRRCDLRIIDESILVQVLEQQADTIDVSTLEATAEIRLGKNPYGTRDTARTATLELNSYRLSLVRALKASCPPKQKPGKVLMAAVADLAAPATLKIRHGKRTKTIPGIEADKAIQLEQRLQESLIERIEQDKPDAKMLAKLTSQLRASRNAERAYEAIAASHRCQRERVFGLAPFLKGTTHKLKLAKRAADMTHLLGRASIALDGTASEDVWRAIVSPTGAPFEGVVKGAMPSINWDAVSITQYKDKAGAKSSLLSPETDAEKKAAMTDEELAAITEHEWLKNLPRFALHTIFDNPEDYARALIAAESKAKYHAGDRAYRKLRADGNLMLFWRFALAKAADLLPRATLIDGKPVSLLIIAQKPVIERLQKLWWPPYVVFKNFGALRGLNDFERVPGGVVLGRARPANLDVELATEALHMHNADVKDIERYDVCPKEGRPWTEEHPDALVNAVLGQITGAEIRQAVARLRLFDRTLATKCELHVFGAWATGLDESHIHQSWWHEADVPEMEVALRYGPVFGNAQLSARSWPGLFRQSKDGTGGPAKLTRAQFGSLRDNLARSVDKRTTDDEAFHDSVRIPIRKIEAEIDAPVRDKYRVPNDPAEDQIGPPIGDSDGVSTGPSFAPAHLPACPYADALSGHDGGGVEGRRHMLIEMRAGTRHGPRTYAIAPVGTTREQVEWQLQQSVTFWQVVPAEALKHAVTAGELMESQKRDMR